MPLDAYDEKLELEAIAGRYKNIAKAVPYTLERLRQSSTFLSVVEQLRKEGWKDWHILLAVFNGVMNWRLEHADASRNVHRVQDNGRALFRKLSQEGESPLDPPIPVAYFTLEEMQMWLEFGMISFLKQKGAVFRQRGYNFEKMRRIVEKRYHYFDVDVAHAPIF